MRYGKPEARATDAARGTAAAAGMNPGRSSGFQPAVPVSVWTEVQATLDEKDVHLARKATSAAGSKLPVQGSRLVVASSSTLCGT